MGMTGLDGIPPVLMYAAGRAGLPQNETTFAKIGRDIQLALLGSGISG